MTLVTGVVYYTSQVIAKRSIEVKAGWTEFDQFARLHPRVRGRKVWVASENGCTECPRAVDMEHDGMTVRVSYA